LFTVVLAGYAAVFLRLPSAGARAGFDPLGPEGRHVEQAIETGRFAEALSVAVDLEQTYPEDLTISYWLTEIYGGLGRTDEEARARERYERLSSEPTGEPR
jgi:hypothetical protein